MSLHPLRTRSYLCGALAGAFSALAMVAHRDGSRAAWLTALLALCSGLLSVRYEERAQQLGSESED